MIRIWLKWLVILYSLLSQLTSICSKKSYLYYPSSSLPLVICHHCNCKLCVNLWLFLFGLISLCFNLNPEFFKPVTPISLYVDSTIPLKTMGLDQKSGGERVKKLQNSFRNRYFKLNFFAKVVHFVNDCMCVCMCVCNVDFNQGGTITHCTLLMW